MKYFFGMDTTEDKNNERYDGERFVSASISEELHAKPERAAGLAEKADKLCAVSPAPRKMAQAFATFAVIWSILLIISLVRGDADFFEIGSCAVGKVPVIEGDTVQPDNGIHGRANLMTHV